MKIPVRPAKPAHGPVTEHATSLCSSEKLDIPFVSDYRANLWYSLTD